MLILTLMNFQKENVAKYQSIDQARLTVKRQTLTYVLRFISIIILTKIQFIKNGFSCIGISQYFSYKRLLYERDLTLNYKDLKCILTLLFLYNAGLRYTLQFCHLSNKIQSRSSLQQPQGLKI